MPFGDAMKPTIIKQIEASKRNAFLELSYLEINDKVIKEVMQSIEPLKHIISKINLDGNQLTDVGAQIIADHLEAFSELDELSIQSNQIGKKGALALFRLRKKQPALDILFHDNQIHDVGEMYEIEQLALLWDGISINN